MEREAVSAYVALGANLGNPTDTVVRAMTALTQLVGTGLVRRSSLYTTEPVDAGGPDYVNAVVELSTSMTAPGMLRALQAIEQDFGRHRPYRNSPRTLDLDLLLYGSGRIESEYLIVPHPRMRERAFVLVPLAEIAPAQVAPSELAAVADQRIERIPSKGSELGSAARPSRN